MFYVQRKSRFWNLIIKGYGLPNHQRIWFTGSGISKKVIRKVNRSCTEALAQEIPLETYNCPEAYVTIGLSGCVGSALNLVICFSDSFSQVPGEVGRKGGEALHPHGDSEDQRVGLQRQGNIKYDPRGQENRTNLKTNKVWGTDLITGVYILCHLLKRKDLKTRL